MKRPPPPLLALVAGLAQQAWPRRAPGPSTVRSAAAAATAAVSLGLAGAAAGRFRAQRTTVEPFDPSKATALVTTGPNALTRNPMYVGMAGLLVANGLRRGTWRSALPLAAFVWGIDRFQIAAEEQALAENFGTEYETYRSAVPRWLDARSLPWGRRS